jgi:hypothetical protein
MTTSIVEYSATEAALAELGQKYKDVVFQVATTEGMKTAIKARAELLKRFANTLDVAVLDADAELIGLLPDIGEQQACAKEYKARKAELSDKK